MPAAYRSVGTGGGTSGSSNRSAAISLTATAGDLLVVFISTSGNTNTSPTCTDNAGGTYDLILSGLWNSSANSFACFVRASLHISASPATITVTVATGANTAAQIGIIAVSGMSKVGAAAVRSSGKQENGAVSTTPAPALNQAALTENMTLSAVASADGTTSPNASWTERVETSQATPTTCLEVATRDSGFSGTAITHGATQ